MATVSVRTAELPVKKTRLSNALPETDRVPVIVLSPDRSMLFKPEVGAAIVRFLNVEDPRPELPTSVEAKLTS